MHIRELAETVDALIQSRQFAEAETVLLEAHKRAVEEADLDTVDFVLSELTALCCLMEPPDIVKAAKFCLEREAARNTGYNKWQTAMMFYWSAHNCPQPLPKHKRPFKRQWTKGIPRPPTRR